LVSKEENKLTPSRKQGHVELCVGSNVTFRNRSAGFDRLHFVHNALPELDYSEIDITTSLFNKTLKVPLLISSMTGGYKEALEINTGLARAAHHFGLGIGIGSARQAMENTEFHESFRTVRREMPNGFVFSNIGAHEAATLYRQRAITELRRIIDLVEADALAIHLNPLQELMQPEGSRNFNDVLAAVESCVQTLGIPVIVKEVGAGISKEVARRLLSVGVQAIDVAGAGGTSWAGVEILRHKEEDRPYLEPFWDWGIPTIDALMQVRELKEDHSFTLIGSGGITNGLDVAKALALGADVAAIARPLIKSLMDGGEKALNTLLENIIEQMKYAMFLTGSPTVTALKQQELIYS